MSRDAVTSAVAEGARWHIELSQLCMCHFGAQQLFSPNDVLCYAVDRYVFKHNVVFICEKVRLHILVETLALGGCVCCSSSLSLSLRGEHV